MGELRDFATGRHIVNSISGKQRGLLSKRKAAPQGKKGQFVGVINDLRARWQNLPDDDPTFDRARALISLYKDCPILQSDD